MKYFILSIFFAFFIVSIKALLLPKIIGGQNADIRNFPYQASLRSEGKHFCGGSIISNRHVLTAAHCITQKKGFKTYYRDVTVSTGTSSSRQTGNSHHIAKVTIHPNWIDNPKISRTNDLAVITLTDQIIFDEWQQKIKIADRNIVSRTIGTLTGWGRTTLLNASSAIQLQKLDMRLLNYIDCQKYNELEIHEKEICAFHSPGRGSCFGDSGGPLVFDNKLVGVLSWIFEDGCATGSAEVFSNVYAQRDFINSAIKKR